MSIFIGGAWPYANGSLHVGHIAALLPGDILARYYRMKGRDVLYVSGSDCNGTPIGIRAKQEGKEIKEIASRFHQEFADCFRELGFSYDIYTRTDDKEHHAVVQDIFTTLHKNGWLYEKRVQQTYCEKDKQFLPDRFVEGICPVCGANARGDQCDHCSTVLDPTELIVKTCKLCGQEPILKETLHLYFALSKFQKPLQHFLKERESKWRENAIHLTKRYLEEGLHDRPVTRDLGNGVEVPIHGFQDKKIYVWIEAVSGYLSASKKWAKDNNRNWKDFWSSETKAYYVHGKDNIPFHSIIWPAILLGIENQNLPDFIISNEYLTLEKKKISTSGNWAVWIPDLLNRYHPDSIRYYLTINAPEKRDTDFSWREFIYSHNSELLGALGNLSQRTIKFYEKEFGKRVVVTTVSNEITEKVKETFENVGELIEEGSIRFSLETIFDFVRWANKQFDEKKPWSIIKEDREKGKSILIDFIYIITSIRNLIHPFLPFTSQNIGEQLKIGEEPKWHPIELPNEFTIENVAPLFERIDLETIDLERGYLVQYSKGY
ncbi:methionine--tRNA ligase [Rossellomorea aquimaris]|uniref:methionine--tRNA ligase n=1 Tax=Rossellomorea aquimaris TaxID=189382 RepID=UPI0007D08029|nr:methionine--tRNA ligase [Rossellomorea aquimaris]